LSRNRHIPFSWWLALLFSFAAATVPARENSTATAASPVQVEALAMLFQVTDQLSGYVTNKDLAAIHNEDVTLGLAVNELLARGDTSGPDAATFKTNLTIFSQRVGDLHLAGDLKNQKRAETALPALLLALDQIRAGFSETAVAEARKRADTFTCSLHSDVVGLRTNLCPKCGAALDQAIRILSFSSGTPLAPPLARASIRTTAPLVVDQTATAFLQLEKATSEAISPPDLIESHTKKLHLLIVDQSLTDYHHEHPTPTKVPGEYTFTFTPHKPGPYRAWADVRPHPLGLQQYAMADIAAAPSASRSLNGRPNSKPLWTGWTTN
jgi:hypothetical protein